MAVFFVPAHRLPEESAVLVHPVDMVAGTFVIDFCRPGKQRNREAKRVIATHTVDVIELCHRLYLAQQRFIRGFIIDAAVLDAVEQVSLFDGGAGKSVEPQQQVQTILGKSGFCGWVTDKRHHTDNAVGMVLQGYCCDHAGLDRVENVYRGIDQAFGDCIRGVCTDLSFAGLGHPRGKGILIQRHRVGQCRDRRVGGRANEAGCVFFMLQKIQDTGRRADDRTALPQGLGGEGSRILARVMIEQVDKGVPVGHEAAGRGA